MAQESPRQAAYRLTAAFHAHFVQASTGGAEETRAACYKVCCFMRGIAEGSGRVTRKAVYQVWRGCQTEEMYARQHGQDAYAAAIRQCGDEIATYLWH